MPRFNGSAFARGLQMVEQFVQAVEPVRWQMQRFGRRVDISSENVFACRPARMAF